MKIRNHVFIVILMLGSMLLTGCSSIGMQGNNNENIPLISGYTCCNLRYEDGGDWISELTYIQWKMIPLGTPASVTEYGRLRAHVNLGGKPMRLGQDYTRKSLSLEQYVKRIIVPEDPNIKLATFPMEIQNAIKLGKVMNGMTKEQVIMSVGYPLTDENPTMDAPFWRMWIDSFSEYQLLWNENGQVKDIVANPITKKLIVYQK
ncbi:MAG: hypothetical protein KBF68_03640 [Nitrosomonas sp.]|nr:hypothetical protein [Nitrosomonas sp.]